MKKYLLYNIKLLLLPILITSIFTPALLHARYRAVRLEIKDTLTGETHEIVTSLSPETYLNHFEGERTFREITILETWMCWGDTSHFKPICPDPRQSEKIADKPD